MTEKELQNLVNGRFTKFILDLNNKIVWGATSVILNEFRKMLQL